MSEIVYNELPLNLVKNFTTLQDVHLHHTGQAKNSIFFLPSVSKAFAPNHLTFCGTKFWLDSIMI